MKNLEITIYKRQTDIPVAVLDFETETGSEQAEAGLALHSWALRNGVDPRKFDWDWGHNMTENQMPLHLTIKRGDDEGFRIMTKDEALTRYPGLADLLLQPGFYSLKWATETERVSIRRMYE